MNNKILFIIIVLFQVCLNLFSQSIENGKIMYINSPNGLRVRSEPSLNGSILGTLLYGENIVIQEKNNVAVTIDGINNYWYKIIKGWTVSGWVFGGYLSENLPSNAPIISGSWEDKNNRRVMYRFYMDYNYWIIRKESGGGRTGKWELSGNILTLIEESYEYEDLSIPEIFKYTFSVIDNNNIKLIRNENVIELIRGNSIY